MQALPGGEEADFVLVSCAGKMAGDNAALASAIEKSTAIKRAGEMGLRRTGLGYTIVRPAELIDEPGGYKALLFDQVPAPEFLLPDMIPDTCIYIRFALQAHTGPLDQHCIYGAI